MTHKLGLILCILMVFAGCTPSNSEASAQELPISDGQFVTNTIPFPPGANREFRTDFSRSLIDFSEIVSGGPPKDGIPAINNPQFVSVSDANQWLHKHEMVFIIDGSVYGEASVRIYPVQILIYHEIINDRFGDTPISITYCPLCNSALAFKGQIDGVDLAFGVSGRLRFSNMLMYDDKTESWWQQATGEAVIGELAGTRLEIVPLLTVSWGEAQALYQKNVQVLSRNTAHRRPYGRNPYVGYDSTEYPFLFLRKEINREHEPFERVIVGRVNEQEKAFLYSALREKIVVEDTIDGVPVVLFWAPDSASPLDASTTSQGRQIGSANIFSARINDQVLNFVSDKEGRIVDRQTNSEWNPLGIAISGPLAEQELTPLPSIQHFWFSYSAFTEE